MQERLALEAHGVSKRYGDHEALSIVDIDVKPGQLHGLLGANGAGKTTLLRILLGLVRRDDGTVRLLGCELSSIGQPLPGGVAGFVDSPAFYPYLSGRSNLTLLARLDDAGETGPHRDIGALLEQVGLAKHASATVAGYSAGMRQRLGVAAAVLRSPRLLVLDEPTSSLDSAGARDMRALVRRMTNEGAAVVFSSHDMAEVEQLCDTLTIIDQGRVVFAGTVADLRRLSPAAVHVLRTTDDEAAFTLASHSHDLKAAWIDGAGLEVSAEHEALDAYVIALGRAGVAVRLLNRRERSLESLFLDLTGHAEREQAPAVLPNHAADSLPALEIS
jgi:ABC-2 type transport system ATP-binding protein